MTFSVLLVEDDPDHAALLEARLRGAGWTTRHVPTLTSGATSYEDDPTDVVLLDLGLPDAPAGMLGGLQFALGWDPPPCVVVLTGRHEDGLGATAVDAGAQDFLTKSVSSTPLLSRVLDHAARRHRAQAVRRDRAADAASAAATGAWVETMRTELRAPLASLLDVAGIAWEAAQRRATATDDDRARATDDEILRSTLHRMRVLGDRALHAIDDVLVEVERSDPRPVALDLDLLTQLAWQQLAPEGATLTIDWLGDGVVGLETTALRAITLLLRDAVDVAPPSGGRVVVDASVEPGAVLLRVHHHGADAPAELATVQELVARGGGAARTVSSDRIPQGSATELTFRTAPAN